MEDISFIFDPTSIINGTKKAANAMGGLAKGASQGAAKISKRIGGAAKSVGKFALKLGVAGLALTGITAALGGIPEIGMAFKAAGSIFIRNFLNPLRRELLPLLNKMLTWVRDNRTAFVRMGAILVSVFRIIKAAIGVIVKLFSKLFETIGNVLENVFGKTTQSISDTFKVLITQVAFFSQIILAFLEPVFETIGKLVGFILSGVIGLFQGILKESGPVLRVFSDIIDMIRGLIETLFGGTEAASGFRDVLFDIGRIVGKVLLVIFEQIKTAIGFVINLVKGLIEGFASVDGIKKAWDGFVSAILTLVDAIAAVYRWLRFLNPVFRFLGRVIGFVLGKALKLVLGLLTTLIKGFTWLVKFLPKLVEFVIKLAKGGFGLLLDIWNSVKNALSSLIDNFRIFLDWVVGLGTKVINIIVTPFKKVKDALFGLGAAILNFFKNLWSKITKFASDAFNFIFNKISSVTESIKGFFGIQTDEEIILKAVKEAQLKAEIKTFSKSPPLTATGKTGGFFSNITNAATFNSTFNVTTTEGDAREAGKNFAEGFNQNIKQQFHDEKINQGVQD